MIKLIDRKDILKMNSQWKSSFAAALVYNYL